MIAPYLPKLVRCVACSNTTSNHKPWCLDHLANQPYVAEVLGTWGRRNAEVQALARGGALRVSGPLVQEALGVLAEPMTAGRLSRLLEVPRPVAEALTAKLLHRGLLRSAVVWRGTRRHVLCRTP